MRMKVVALLQVLVFALLQPGCETPNVMKPLGEVAVRLDAVKKRGAIRVEHANVITFTLPPCQAGFAWKISFHDTRYLKQQTPILPPKTAGEGSTVAFMAINHGSTRLRFVLVPESDAQSVAPIDQQEVAVAIF